MKRRRILGMVVAGVAACVPTAAASADIFYDEGFAGDLSDDRLNPSAFVLSAGDNTLIGVLTGDDGQGGIDRDYFSITIPVGAQLDQMVHTDYISTDFGVFVGVMPGPVFPIAPEDATPNDLLGWAIIGPATVGLDILPTMGGNGTGFTPPLPAGTYTFWVQQTGEYTDYAVNFVVTPVPGPGGWLGVGAAAWWARRRRARVTLVL